MVTDALVVIFGVGALVHLCLAATYLAFATGPNRWLGAWLCASWAVGLVRLVTLLTFYRESGLDAVIIWANVLAASLACLISIWRRASATWGTS